MLHTMSHEKPGHLHYHIWVHVFLLPTASMHYFQEDFLKKSGILELITVQYEFAEFVTWVQCAGKWSQFCGLVGGWVGVRSTLCYPEWEEILWGVTEIQNRNKHTSLSHEEAFLYGWVGIICLHSNGLHKCAIYFKGIIYLKILISVACLCVVPNPNEILAYVNCSRRELKDCAALLPTMKLNGDWGC